MLDKQAVGFFWAEDEVELAHWVDEIAPVAQCEYLELEEGGGFVWDGKAPAIGVPEPDENALEKKTTELLAGVSVIGAPNTLFGGTADATDDDWLPLEIFEEEMYEWLPKMLAEREAKIPKPRPIDLIPDPITTVYFIQGGDHIKIGITNGPVAKRLKALSTAHHQELVLLATQEDASGKLEIELHERFAHLRVRGEWFRAEPDLLAYIEAIKK